MRLNAVLLSKVGISAVAGLMLMGGLCQRTVGTTITIVNGTDAPIRNIEVSYRGGTIGTAMIAPHDQMKQWVPAKGDCSVKLTFMTPANKQIEPTAISTKKPCPSVVMFTIDPEWKVTTDPH
jgi:hypothetical protein